MSFIQGFANAIREGDERRFKSRLVKDQRDYDREVRTETRANFLSDEKRKRAQAVSDAELLRSQTLADREAALAQAEAIRDEKRKYEEERESFLHKRNRGDRLTDAERAAEIELERFNRARKAAEDDRKADQDFKLDFYGVQLQDKRRTAAISKYGGYGLSSVNVGSPSKTPSVSTTLKALKNDFGQKMEGNRVIRGGLSNSTIAKLAGNAQAASVVHKALEKAREMHQDAGKPWDPAVGERIIEEVYQNTEVGRPISKELIDRIVESEGLEPGTIINGITIEEAVELDIKSKRAADVLPSINMPNLMTQTERVSTKAEILGSVQDFIKFQLASNRGGASIAGVENLKPYVDSPEAFLSTPLGTKKLLEMIKDNPKAQEADLFPSWSPVFSSKKEFDNAVKNGLLTEDQKTRSRFPRPKPVATEEPTTKRDDPEVKKEVVKVAEEKPEMSQSDLKEAIKTLEEEISFERQNASSSGFLFKRESRERIKEYEKELEELKKGLK